VRINRHFHDLKQSKTKVERMMNQPKMTRTVGANSARHELRHAVFTQFPKATLQLHYLHCFAK
jgi:hypothetical protein